MAEPPLARPIPISKGTGRGHTALGRRGMSLISKNDIHLQKCTKTYSRGSEQRECTSIERFL